MSGAVVGLWRHPIKSHGREELPSVTLTAGQTMPWDRTWAVAHEAAKTDGSEWAPCASFSRSSKAPELQAIHASLNEGTGRITLRHHARPDLTFNPDGDIAEFLDWVAPLMPKDRAASARIVRVPGRGMTDTEFPSISLCNLASHRAVERKIGHDLSPLRWRGNIWIDGLNPWQEMDWPGRVLRIGTAELRVVETIKRCLATTANPETGKRDADTLGALKSGWDHQNFGVCAEVTVSGTVRPGDRIELVE